MNSIARHVLEIYTIENGMCELNGARLGWCANVQIVPEIPAKELTRERRFCKMDDCWSNEDVDWS